MTIGSGRLRRIREAGVLEKEKKNKGGRRDGVSSGTRGGRDGERDCDFLFSGELKIFFGLKGGTIAGVKKSREVCCREIREFLIGDSSVGRSSCIS